MSASIADLRKTIGSAEDLHSVVRTMKALAASSIAQYEQSVRALDDYHHAVRLGLGVCIRSAGDRGMPAELASGSATMVVFGSDQGLVGRFNDRAADCAIAVLAKKQGMQGAGVWAVGERVREPLVEAGLTVTELFVVPQSVKAIVSLVAQILNQYEDGLDRSPVARMHLVYNKPAAGAVYEPTCEKLLPLDDAWRRELADLAWPVGNLPDVIGAGSTTLAGFIREYLFVSLFRASAASLASENASRLAAMQRADKNIESLLDDLNTRFHRRRQEEIDGELFDVVAGYEAQRR